MKSNQGILSIILALVGFILTVFVQSLIFSIIGIVFAFIALILGVLGYTKAESRDISIIGIVIGIIDLISWIIIFLLFPEYLGVL